MSRAMTTSPGICPVAGCTRLIKVKGLCGTHYKQQRRTGQITAEIRPRAASGEEGVIQLTPVRVSSHCASILASEAEKRGVSVYHLQRQVLEDWTKKASS